MQALENFWTQKRKELITAASILATIFTIYTGIVFIEDRYVLAADFSVQMEKQSQVLKQYRVQQLEDKIFELEFKSQSGVDTPLDRALKERYKQQLERMK